MRVRRFALLLGAVVVGLALGIGIDIARVGGLELWSARRGVTEELLVPPYVASGRSIEVDGRAVYLDCRGEGSPTVVLEAGFASGASSWGHLLHEVAAFTRVCAWDRPGIGRSAARDVHTAGEATDDLRAALAAAGERGPFVIAGHSFGGVYARIFADRANANDPADAVLGFVMIDTYEPDLGIDVDPAVPADMRAMVRESLDSTAEMLRQGESLDWPATMAELDAAGIIQLPTVFLTVDPYGRYSDPDPTRLAAIIDAWHRAVARRYANGQIEILQNTGHMIHLEQPALVTQRIREILDQVRGG